MGAESDTEVTTSMINEKSNKKKIYREKPSDKFLQFKMFLSWSLKYMTSLLIGILFGYAMEKAKVYEPIAIRQQMIFQKFIMLKMFLSALAISTVSTLIAANVFHDRYNKILNSGKEALKSKSLRQLIIGGLLIGVGMQISGSCPGMVLVQLGAGVPSSMITFIGCLSGGLVHGLLNTCLTSYSNSNELISRTISDLISIKANNIRFFFIILLACIVFLMEYFVPWTIDYTLQIEESNNIFAQTAWPPYGK